MILRFINDEYDCVLCICSNKTGGPHEIEEEGDEEVDRGPNVLSMTGSVQNCGDLQLNYKMRSPKLLVRLPVV